MADNKMDIDPSGDPDRADLSDPAASLFCPIRYRGKLKKTVRIVFAKYMLPVK